MRRGVGLGEDAGEDGRVDVAARSDDDDVPADHIDLGDEYRGQCCGPGRFDDQFE